MCMPVAHRDQKKDRPFCYWKLLLLELQMAVNQPVGTENWSGVLCKSSGYSLTAFSSSLLLFQFAYLFTSLGMCVCRCADVWRPEVNLRCHSSVINFILFFKLIYFYLFIYCVHMHAWVHLCAPRACKCLESQTRSYKLVHASWYGCWEPKLGLLQEHQMLLIPEPSLQPQPLKSGPTWLYFISNKTAIITLLPLTSPYNCHAISLPSHYHNKNRTVQAEEYIQNRKYWECLDSVFCLIQQKNKM